MNNKLLFRRLFEWYVKGKNGKTRKEWEDIHSEAVSISTEYPTARGLVEALYTQLARVSLGGEPLSFKREKEILSSAYTLVEKKTDAQELGKQPEDLAQDIYKAITERMWN